MKSNNTHPPRESTEWDNPDICPFCGAALRDGGAGFIEHIETAETCRERFEGWLENISGDMGSTWTG
jgi:hypothetical protein